jgi:hypothetical protein
LTEKEVGRIADRIAMIIVLDDDKKDEDEPKVR